MQFFSAPDPLRLGDCLQEDRIASSDITTSEPQADKGDPTPESTNAGRLPFGCHSVHLSTVAAASRANRPLQTRGSQGMGDPCEVPLGGVGDLSATLGRV